MQDNEGILKSPKKVITPVARASYVRLLEPAKSLNDEMKYSVSLIFPPEADLKEMKKAAADYRVVVYPGAKHSFTNPEADDYAKKFKMPVGYNAEADKKSWEEMKRFLREVLGQ